MGTATPVAGRDLELTTRRGSVRAIRRRVGRSATICLLLILLPGTRPPTGQNITPSSGRSRAAIGRVAPALQAALAEQDLAYGAPIFMRIFKESRELELWVEGRERFGRPPDVSVRNMRYAFRHDRR